MRMEWIFWAMLLAAIAHVLEEYFGGFLEQMGKIVPGVTVTQFVVINALFLLICLAGALAPPGYLVFAMSIPALLAVNAFIHIGAAIRLRGYAAGLITALVFYLPLPAYAYYRFTTDGTLALEGVILSVALGAFWMLVPLLYQGARLASAGMLSRKNIRF